MENPFESGHIKNYILFYISVIVIVILFFIESKLFHDNKDVEKKVFNTEAIKDINIEKKADKQEEKNLKSRFKLLDKTY